MPTTVVEEKCKTCKTTFYTPTQQEIKEREEWNVPWGEEKYKLCIKCANKLKWKKVKCRLCGDEFKMNIKQLNTRKAIQQPLDVCSECLQIKPENNQTPLSANFYIYERGQIWWWQDPVSGDKSTTPIQYVPNILDINYSRYVLLLQDPKTISQHPKILVLPLSISVTSPIQITFIDNMKPFIQCDSIKVVALKDLVRYAAKLSDDVMDQVELEVMRLLMPDRYFRSCIDEGISPIVISNGNNHSYAQEETVPGIRSEIIQDTMSELKEVLETSSPITIKRSKTSDTDTKEVKISKPLTVWTDEKKKQFIADYTSDPNLAASVYGFTPKTAVAYYRRFRADLKAKGEAESESSVEVVKKPDEFNSSFAPDVISRLANTVKYYLLNEHVVYGTDLYQSVKPYLKRGVIYQSYDTFVNDLGTAIYRSLNSFFDIQIDKSTKAVLSTPTINDNTRNRKSWLFLARLDNNLINLSQTTKEIIDAFKICYPDETFGFEQTWKQYLRKELSNKIPLTSPGIEAIVNAIAIDWIL